MIQIIDGRRYNTETATKVAKWSNGYGSSDFKYCWETLYRTPKGNWFVEYEGGALSQYAESYGNSRGGSSGIKALSVEEAFEWLQEREEPEALEQYFADRIQDA